MFNKTKQTANIQDKYIIFLDCDGVINKLRPDMKMFSYDEECIRRLAKITDYLNGKVVLCSTWRAGFDTKNGNHADYIKEIISVFQSYGIEITGVTPDSGHEEKRAEEIDYYCRRNNVSNYVILDDDESLYNNKSGLFLIQSKTGITDKDVANIMKKIKVKITS